jgi:hypothetical protein
MEQEFVIMICKLTTYVIFFLTEDFLSPTTSKSSVN